MQCLCNIEQKGISMVFFKKLLEVTKKLEVFSSSQEVRFSIQVSRHLWYVFEKVY